MCHSGSAEGFDQSFLDNTVLDIEVSLHAPCCGAPADAVGEAGYVLNLRAWTQRPSRIGDGP